MLRLLGCLQFASLAWVAGALAAPEPVVQLSLQPEHGLHTGQLLTVTLAVTVADGDDVAVPEQAFDPWLVQRKRVQVEPPRDGKRSFRFTLQLLAAQPGEMPLGPLKLRHVTRRGEVKELQTPAAPVRVLSWLANEPNAQPKAATQPVPVMQPDYTLAWLLGGLLLMALTALLTWWGLRWWRRRARRVVPLPPPRPPWELALESLARLREDRPLAVEQGRLRVWIEDLSDAVRHYVGRRYGFEGLESTSDEIVMQLRSLPEAPSPPEPKPPVEPVASMLQEFDLVKFAKVPADGDRCAALLEEATRLVETTRPAALPSASLTERPPEAVR